MSELHESLVAPTAAKLVAEADKLAAEAEKARAEAQVADCGKRLAALQEESQLLFLAEQKERFAEFERDLAFERAGDERHFQFWFNGAVSDASVTACVNRLAKWDRYDPTSEWTVVFNSPGGAVIPGMALFDFLRAQSGAGHRITTVCRGYAASMAGILLQAGDVRVIGPQSYLMIHEISAGTSGKIGEIQDAVKFYETISERVVDIFVTRSGGKCTKAAFIKNWKRQDWWLTSEETLKYGFADRIG